MQRVQESETLCRKGGTSRSDNAPLASRACAGAKLACGATLSATREIYNGCVGAQLTSGASLSATGEFVGLVRVLNLLVVPAFLRRGNLRGLRGCLIHDFARPLLFRGIKLQTGEAEFACVK